METATETRFGEILSRAQETGRAVGAFNCYDLLGFEAVVQRDYPIVFGTLYIYTLVGLLLNLVSDLTYVAVDPRIDFATRET